MKWASFVTRIRSYPRSIPWAAEVAKFGSIWAYIIRVYTFHFARLDGAASVHLVLLTGRQNSVASESILFSFALFLLKNISLLFSFLYDLCTQLNKIKSFSL